MRNAIGNTKIDENDNIAALLGQQKVQEKISAVEAEKPGAEKAARKEENTAEKLKHNRSAKFTDLEIEQLEKIMLATGTDKVSKALRWCLSKAWEAHGEEIERISEQKKQIGTL